MMKAGGTTVKASGLISIYDCIGTLPFNLLPFDPVGPPLPSACDNNSSHIETTRLHDFNSNQNSIHQIFIVDVSTTVLWSSSGHIKFKLRMH